MAVSVYNDLDRKSSSRGLRSPLTFTILSLIAAVLLAVAVRVDHPKQTRDEVARETSPDGSVSAVVYELSGDAKDPFSYQVGIVTQGKVQIVADLSGAMRNERAYGVNLRWLSNDDLRVEYLQALNQSLRANQIRVAGDVVHVSLHAGIRDENAQAGGMLFNLQQMRQP
jgi:hypothetical protein